MKRWIVALLVVSSGVHAEPLHEIKVTTHAKCSPAVGINYGKVTVNCTDPLLEEKLRRLPDLTNYNQNIEQLTSLRTQTSELSARLKALTSTGLVTAEDVRALRDKLTNAEAKFSGLWREHELLRAHLADALAGLPEMIQGEINASVPAISAAVAQSVYDQQFQKFSQSLYYDIDQELKEFRSDLDSLKERVEALQNDVAFLMKEFYAGNLKDSVGFIGLAIGGGYFTSSWQRRIGIDYEMLLPTIHFLDMPGSVFIELARIDWKEERDYQALPGLQPISREEVHDMTGLSVGARLFLQRWSDELQSYVGAAFGHSVAGAENTFSYSFAFGTEYFRRTTRVAFELRWDGYSNIERKEVTFNPFGSASVRTVAEARDGWYAGVRVAFR